MPYFLHNRQRIFYREQGNGPLMLLLPGNTASSAHHQGDLDYFAGRYHVVAPDFPGTGRSDRMARWPTSWWEDNAHAMAALVDHLGYEGCVAVGASGGAMVALLMAIAHPDVVRAVIADSTAATC
jgi:pimeloyl-ACP methyl ester carboxylesterase